MKGTFYTCLLWACTISLMAQPSTTVAQETVAQKSAHLKTLERPNVVWIMSEDNSCHYLKLFSKDGASTPNIQRLAANGVVFDRAFSNSPVCSVARTTLITSIYAPKLGTQFHRKIQPAGLPPGWKLFPEYLKNAGYYTTNNSKTDYNVSMVNQSPWNASSRKATWRNRPDPKQPFFHVQTFAQSHESSLHFPAQDVQEVPTKTDLDTVQLAPFYPQTELFRYTHARYHDRIGVIDNQVGNLVAKLNADGLLDDTFIFYFGDHGGVLPRSKGYVYETGLHVPLVVYIPKNFQHLTPFAPGQRSNGFVEFVDFGPTVLRLAGLPVPKQMDGLPFLDKDAEGLLREGAKSTLGYADRFDEKYDMVRSLRTDQLKYIRNFNAIYPNGLENQYRYKMAAYTEWRDLSDTDSLNELENRFFQPKPVEELYDLSTDPFETRNLADDPKFQTDLKQMRRILNERMKSMPDSSLYPESFLIQKTETQPKLFSEVHKTQIAHLLDIANLSLAPYSRAEAAIQAALESKSPWARYWGLIVCSTFGEQAIPLASSARALLTDKEPEVRLRAIEFLGLINQVDPIPLYVAQLQQSNNQATTLNLLNSLVFYTDFVVDQRSPLDLGTLPFGDLPFIRNRIDYLARDASH
ncbi:MAG: sulfatase-like hydrolase/transferase [Mariniblastus sp.]|nr:sulfatase-like hydrolase/transferase [Mariniblastus sp.]